MSLSLVKDKNTSNHRPHAQAFRDNDAAIRATRAQLNAVNEKDAKAAADCALCDATAGQIATLQSEVDGLRADAVYSSLPPPDTSEQEKKLAHLQQLLKTQTDHARAAAVVRSKYDADRQKLNAEISRRAALNPKLLFDALLLDCLVPLAPRALAARQKFLDEEYAPLYAAALACDTISREHGFGQFVSSSSIAYLNIPFPDHPAFDPNPLMPEAAHAKRKQFEVDVAKAASDLVLGLLKE
jgi:hypothetical protein